VGSEIVTVIDSLPAAAPPPPAVLVVDLAVPKLNELTSIHPLFFVLKGFVGNSLGLPVDARSMYVVAAAATGAAAVVTAIAAASTQ
jgi:hypothetical protein